MTPTNRYYISVAYHYYSGTISAPVDGPLTNERGETLRFATRGDAVAYLTTDRDDYGDLAMGCESIGGGKFAARGTFVTPHGCYARPVYRIRTNKSSAARYLDNLQRRHPGTRRQLSAHGADRYSVQLFDRQTGQLVADYNIPTSVGRG